MKPLERQKNGEMQKVDRLAHVVKGVIYVLIVIVISTL